MSLKINGTEKIKNGDLEGTDVSSFKIKTNRGGVETPAICEHLSYVYVPSSIPLSQEERHDTLVYAMDKWIKGMMKACGGKVKAWDVVNEAISGGGNDGEVHKYFNPYDTPYEAFINYMNVLSDFIIRVNEEYSTNLAKFAASNAEPVAEKVEAAPEKEKKTAAPARRKAAAKPVKKAPAKKAEETPAKKATTAKKAAAEKKEAPAVKRKK